MFLTMHSNVTIKNISWPHFSRATLYIAVCTMYAHRPMHGLEFVTKRTPKIRKVYFYKSKST